MSSTFSINIGQSTESTRKENIFSILQDLPNNTSKLISPRDVRDAFLSTWANSSFKVTTPGTFSTDRYIGIDSVNPSDRDIKSKILIGKRQYGNLDIMSNNLLTSNTDILVFESALAFSIIESIKFVNLTSSIIPVKLYWADANNVIKAHFAHNLSLPSNSTLETIIKPKRVSQGDRIFASYKNAGSNSVSVFLSARTGYEYTSVGYTPNVTPSGTVSVSFGSSESDGTLIYYTIE
jgi:hypothetical protein